MSNALLDETRSERIDLSFPMLPQLRVSSTLRTLIDESKPADQSYAEWFTRAAVTYLLLPSTIGLNLGSLNRLVVRIVGGEGRQTTGQPDMRQEAPESLTGVRAERQKPVQMRLKTAMVAVGKR